MYSLALPNRFAEPKSSLEKLPQDWQRGLPKSKSQYHLAYEVKIKGGDYSEFVKGLLVNGLLDDGELFGTGFGL